MKQTSVQILNQSLFQDVSEICTITVTFHPDISKLSEQISHIPSTCTKIIVDNGSSPEIIEEIKLILQFTNNSFLIENNENLGLGRAINKGATFAKKLKKQPKYLLLLDQDSIPRKNSIEVLLNAFLNLKHNAINVGCVGPNLIDEKTNLSHGFHQATTLRWKRLYPNTNDYNFIQCATINGSGTLVPLNTFNELGGLDENLFIDHIDTEWSFRLTSKKYELWGVPQAVFTHNMGENSLRFWFFGWKVWPVRSAFRHQYLFRNAVLLLGRDYIPKVWKFWAILKLLMTFVIVGIYDKNRLQQIRNMVLGIIQGIRYED